MSLKYNITNDRRILFNDSTKAHLASDVVPFVVKHCLTDIQDKDHKSYYNSCPKEIDFDGRPFGAFLEDSARKIAAHPQYQAIRDHTRSVVPLGVSNQMGNARFDMISRDILCPLVRTDSGDPVYSWCKVILVVRLCGDLVNRQWNAENNIASCIAITQWCVSFLTCYVDKHLFSGRKTYWCTVKDNIDKYDLPCEVNLVKPSSNLLQLIRKPKGKPTPGATKTPKGKPATADTNKRQKTANAPVVSLLNRKACGTTQVQLQPTKAISLTDGSYLIPAIPVNQGVPKNTAPSTVGRGAASCQEPEDNCASARSRPYDPVWRNFPMPTPETDSDDEEIQLQSGAVRTEPIRNLFPLQSGDTVLDGIIDLEYELASVPNLNEDQEIDNLQEDIRFVLDDAGYGADSLEDLVCYEEDTEDTEDENNNQ